MVGAVTMDQLMVACPGNTRLGDEVVLIGRQGGDEVTVSEWAERPAVTDIGERLANRFGNDVSDQSVFVGYRLYPWADRPDLIPG